MSIILYGTFLKDDIEVLVIELDGILENQSLLTTHADQFKFKDKYPGIIFNTVSNHFIGDLYSLAFEEKDITKEVKETIQRYKDEQNAKP